MSTTSITPPIPVFYNAHEPGKLGFALLLFPKSQPIQLYFDAILMIKNGVKAAAKRLLNLVSHPANFVENVQPLIITVFACQNFDVFWNFLWQDAKIYICFAAGFGITYLLLTSICLGYLLLIRSPHINHYVSIKGRYHLGPFILGSFDTKAFNYGDDWPCDEDTSDDSDEDASDGPCDQKEPEYVNEDLCWENPRYFDDDKVYLESLRHNGVGREGNAAVGLFETDRLGKDQDGKHDQEKMGFDVDMMYEAEEERGERGVDMDEENLGCLTAKDYTQQRQEQEGVLNAEPPEVEEAWDLEDIQANAFISSCHEEGLVFREREKRNPSSRCLCEKQSPKISGHFASK